MSTELTQALKKIVVQKNVNQAFMVNKGKLVFTKFTQSLKDFVGFAMLTKIFLVNTWNLLRISVYRVGSANEGFYYFEE